MLSKPPTISSNNARLLIVGSTTSHEETMIGQPFVDNAGNILQSAFRSASALVGQCYLISGPQESDYEEIKRILEDYKPNCILLLGQSALDLSGCPHSVDDMRGSIFLCEKAYSPFCGYKCTTSFDHWRLMRTWEDKPLFDLDVRRALKESHFPEIVRLPRVYDVELTPSQIISKLEAIQPGTWTSVDIEGGVQQGVTCVGISTDPSSAFIVNFNDFDEEAQLRILRSLASVLCNPDIPKVLQNSLYDNFVLSWLWKMPIRNVIWDTMLSSWEIFPELPKGLGTQVSIWTDQPYYKNERTISDKLTHYRYCCTDAAVTLEIALKHRENLLAKPEAYKHFQFNMSLLPALLYMELKGISYDVSGAREHLLRVEVEMSTLQATINKAAGEPLNVNSPKQMQRILFTKLAFEPQYKIVKGRKSNTLTTDVEALLTLYKKSAAPLIHDILVWRQQESLRKQLEIKSDADERIRCSYNPVGTETGRLTCYESPTGTGYNLQTITKKLRYLYRSDKGKTFFQCDLSGADGWTVAARCAEQGDNTMWDDYVFGLKPARIIAAMQIAQNQNLNIRHLSREELRDYIKKIEIPDWLYEACKAVQHGSNYGMKKNTMSSNLLKQSWKKSGKPLYVSPADCDRLQSLYLNGRYTGIARWHDSVKQNLLTTGRMGCASGHVRTFFGRRTDHMTLQAALSHEPQANTTFATNKALERLWNDPENRREDDSLIIEPLHQVHDALIGQFDDSLVDWAIPKICEWFNNPIVIGQKTFTIPFEGGYGKDWLNLNVKFP